MITGASSGIGEALARRYSDLGANLVLLARRIDRLNHLATELSRSGAEALAVQADVSKDGETESAVAAAVAKFGRIDVVIANAGFGVAGTLEKLSLEDFRRQFEVNVFGVLRTVKACLPELKKTQGRIGLIGSVASRVSLPESTAYSMSKFALAGLSPGLSAELASSGVSVTLIMPGFIDTDIFGVSNRNEPVKGSGKDRPPAWLTMPAPRAARKIERAITRRKREKVITIHGKIAVCLQRFFPGLMNIAMKQYAKSLS